MSIGYSFKFGLVLALSSLVGAFIGYFISHFFLLPVFRIVVEFCSSILRGMGLVI